MSKLEVEAKEFIEPMIHGRRVVLEPAARKTVAAWITLKMMIYEHTDPRAVVFDRAQTIEFSVSRTMPENIQIWLFRSSEHDLRARITRSFTSLFRAGDDLASVSKKANTQTVLFGVGKMLAFFQYSRIPDLELGKIRQMDAVALWPLNGRAVTWPPMKSIDVAGAQHLALTLNRFVTRPEMKRLF